VGGIYPLSFATVAEDNSANESDSDSASLLGEERTQEAVRGASTPEAALARAAAKEDDSAHRIGAAYFWQQPGAMFVLFSLTRAYKAFRNA
jgi:hypothetical protein